MVPPHLCVLSERGGEEDHRRGQRDQKDPQTTEEEGEKGDKNPPAGSVPAHRAPHVVDGKNSACTQKTTGPV